MNFASIHFDRLNNNARVRWILSCKYPILLFSFNYIVTYALYNHGDFITLNLSHNGQFFAAFYCAFISSILMCVKGAIGVIARLMIACTYSLLLSSLFSIQSLPNASIIASFFETTLVEVISMLKYMHFSPFIFFTLIIFAIHLHTKKITPIEINVKFLLTIGLLSLFPYGLYLNESPDKYEHLGNKSNADIYEKLSILSENFAVASRHILQKNITLYFPLMSAKYYYEKAKVTQYQSQERILPDFAKLNQSVESINLKPKKIILIIGESANKHHYKTYGYTNNSDPFLFEITKKNIGHSVNDAISPASITIESVPRQLTFASPVNFNDYYTYLNVVELANHANYETSWISNQRKVGSNESAIGAIATSSKQSIFVQKGDTEISFSLDSELLAPFKKLLKRDNTPQFIALHLVGSHLDYRDKHDDSDYIAVKDSPDLYRHYDASIHHTDKVIKSVYETLKPLGNSLIIYMPDHGEKVNVGHGLNVLDRSQYEIPLIAIGESKYLDQFKLLIEKYSEQKNTFNTSNMIYVLSEMMGYGFSEESTKKAIFEGGYIFHVNQKYYSENF